SGSGELLTDLNASELVSGIVPLARLSGITNNEIAANAGIYDTQLSTISTPGKVFDSALSSNVNLLDAAQTVDGVKTYVSSLTVTSVLGVPQVELADNVKVSSTASMEEGGGVRISSNTYIVGFASATKYYGDGSGLTNLQVAGDNLGNHIAAQALNMADQQIINISSLTVTGADAATGYSVSLSSGIYMPAGRVEAGLYSGSGALLTELNASNLALGTVPLARLSGITNNEIAANAGIYDTQLTTISTPGKVFDSALSANVNLLGSAQTVSGVKTYISSLTVTSALGAPRVELGEGVFISSTASIEQGGGVYASTNLFVAGFVSATKYYGDGSALNNLTVPGDNLGNHLATGTLNMAGFQIMNISSLTVTGWDPDTGYSLWLSSGLNMPDGRVEAALYSGSGELLTELNASNLALGTVPLVRLAGITNAEIAAAAGIYDTQLSTISTPGKVFDSALSDNVGLLDADQTATGIKTFTSSVTVAELFGVPRLQLADNVFISSTAEAAQDGGVYVSTNAFFSGNVTAVKFYGDGSGLNNLNVPGDNLGNHLATTTLDMANFQIVNISSLTVTGTDAATGYSVSLSSGLYMPDGRVEAGLYSGSGALLIDLDASNLARGTVPLERLSGITNAELDAAAGIYDTQLATISTPGKVFDSALSDNVNLLDAAQTVGGVKTYVSSLTVTSVLGTPQLQFEDNVFVSSTASENEGRGVYVSSNLYVVGYTSAAKFFGDGSGLTNLQVAGDNLGNHVATQDLNMADNYIANVASLSVTGTDAATGYSLWLSSGLNMPDGRVEAALYSGSGELLTDLNASNLASGTVPLARLAGITNNEIASDAGIYDTQLSTISTPGKVFDSALSDNVNLLDAAQTVAGIKTFTSSVTVNNVMGAPLVRL
ncbi:MAG: hypothetical protein COT18_10865, partial [Elusimicrobia bacterium CG08_land_8_20_14_0_20_59_10]